jgi:hypothetical protein
MPGCLTIRICPSAARTGVDVFKMSAGAANSVALAKRARRRVIINLALPSIYFLRGEHQTHQVGCQRLCPRRNQFDANFSRIDLRKISICKLLDISDAFQELHARLSLTQPLNES